MKKNLKVLVACEFSGQIRAAFANRDWEAWSCDLRQTETPLLHNNEHHHQGVMESIIGKDWDLVVSHPPCQFLSNSGVRWLYNPDGSRNEPRWSSMILAAKFFQMFWKLDVPFLAVENPIMNPHARKLIFGDEGIKPVSITQPWWFGHPEIKATCWWTRNLPKLVPTNNVREEMMKLTYHERAKVHHEAPGPDREKNRSRTLPGVADALALQWGGYIEKHYQKAPLRT